MRAIRGGRCEAGCKILTEILGNLADLSRYNFGIFVTEIGYKI